MYCIFTPSLECRMKYFFLWIFKMHFDFVQIIHLYKKKKLKSSGESWGGGKKPRPSPPPSLSSSHLVMFCQLLACTHFNNGRLKKYFFMVEKNTGTLLNFNFNFVWRILPFDYTSSPPPPPPPPPLLKIFALFFLNLPFMRMNIPNNTPGLLFGIQPVLHKIFNN